MAGFDDIEFPSFVNWGAKGGPTFKTTVVTSTSGYEQRMVDFDAPRLTWQFDTTLATPAEIATIIQFYRARFGRAYGFRFRDWTDYMVGMQFVSGNWVPNGSPVQLVNVSTGAFIVGDGTTTVFQLSIIYVDSVRNTFRKITRPVTGYINIYLNSVLQASGYTVDVTTGLVTFSAAPGAGVAIQWAGLYDVPCRFDTDSMDLTSANGNIADWTSIKIIEIRE